jgi:serine/threonine-protein kinase HipA
MAGDLHRLRFLSEAGFAASIGLPERAALSANALALKAAASLDLKALPFTGSPLAAAERELRSRRAQLET